MSFVGRLSNNSSKYFIPAKDLQNGVPKWDYHLHSDLTDGQDSIASIVKHSILLRLERIIFTEHTEPWLTKTQDWFREYSNQVNACQEEYHGKIEILMGLEVPAIDFIGNFELSDRMDKEACFLLGAAHRYPEIEGRRVRDLSKDEAIDLEFRTLMGLAQNPDIDAIAHIGGTCQKYCGPFPEEFSREVIRTATRTGIAIEINHRYHQPLERFLKICVEEQARITIGSNAHSLPEVGAANRELKTLLEDGK